MNINRGIGIDNYGIQQLFQSDNMKSGKSIRLLQ